MKGPPKVEPNSRSAPGPIPAKKGIYSMSIISTMPPAMQRALRHQQDMKPPKPGLFAAGGRIWANILLLLSRKNRANMGRYTKNCSTRSPVKLLKKGHMNL